MGYEWNTILVDAKSTEEAIKKVINRIENEQNTRLLGEYFEYELVTAYNVNDKDTTSKREIQFRSDQEPVPLTLNELKMIEKREMNEIKLTPDTIGNYRVIVSKID